MATNMQMDYANCLRQDQETERVGRRSASHDGHAQYQRVFRMAALCLGVMCILQASLNIALRLHYTFVQTSSNYSIVAERDQLQKKLSELQASISDLNQTIRYFNSSLYYVSTKKKSWAESRDNCMKTGTDLVIINSKEEQEYIFKEFGGAAWIGLTDAEKDGEWKWVDGSNLTNGFWAEGEPNNFNGPEDCAANGYGSKCPVLSWADYPCSLAVVGICEKRLTI